MAILILTMELIHYEENFYHAYSSHRSYDGIVRIWGEELPPAIISQIPNPFQLEEGELLWTSYRSTAPI